MRRVPILAIALLLAMPAVAHAHWPVVGGRVTQWFNPAGHDAIDIAAACGTRIVAAAHGKVVYSGWKSNGGGYQVWIRTPRTGRDLWTIYAHMRTRPPVGVGTWVATEQRIGYVGSTGNSTGCHVHVEMWRGHPWWSGSWSVNPWPRIDHGRWFPY